MKAAVRILVTATTLAALTMLSLAATATATVPQRDERTQHPTTIEPTTVPHPGHGAQVDREDATPRPAASHPPTALATRSTRSRRRSQPWPQSCSACSSPWPGRPGSGGGIDHQQPSDRYPPTL